MKKMIISALLSSILIFPLISQAGNVQRHYIGLSGEETLQAQSSDLPTNYSTVMQTVTTQVMFDITGKSSASGSIQGATITDGPFKGSRALRFQQDTTDYANLSSNQNILTANDMTLEMWVRPIVTAHEDWNYLAVSWGSNWKYEYGFYGSLWPQFKIWTSTGNYSVGAGEAIPQDQWSHLAVIKEGTTMRYYVNGQIKQTMTNVTGTVNPSTNVMLGGGYSGKPYKGIFRGDIAEIRVWNYARSVEDLKKYQFTKLRGNEEGLIGYWEFGG